MSVIKLSDYLDKPSDEYLIELEKKSDIILIYTEGQIEKEFITTFEEASENNILVYELGPRGSGGDSSSFPIIEIAQWARENITLVIILNIAGKFVLKKGVEWFIEKILTPKLQAIKNFLLKANKTDGNRGTYKIPIRIKEDHPFTTFLIPTSMTKEDQLDSIEEIGIAMREIYKNPKKAGHKMIYDTKNKKWIRL